MDLVERVKAILLRPAAEWPVIERESGDMQVLFANYVAILALIPAIATFIGTALVGVSGGPLGTIRVPIFLALFTSVLGYVFSFVIVYVIALLIDALAPTFGGQKNFDQALKLSAYSYTPFWLAGIFMVIPRLGWLTILGLYGLYLLYLGLPVLMKAPKERALLYGLTVVGFAVVIAVVLGLIQAAVL